MGRSEERREEKRVRQREEWAKSGLVYREDCPCPKTSCVNHGYCEPCKEKHKKNPPYCMRQP
jgi:hypothetical protein